MTNSKRIYLDYAAATPIDPAVQAEMEPYFNDQFGNPSSLHIEGRAAHQALESARSRVAKVLGARAGEIIFTAGATEAINLSIQGLVKLNPDSNILAAATEHQAVLANLEALGDRGRLVPVKRNGKIKLDELERLIDDRTVLICVAQINSELGTIQPLAGVAELVAKVRQERKRRGNERTLYLLSDSSAAAGHVSLAVNRLGVDMMVLSAAKCYGPKQSGALYLRHGLELAPLILGGGQERGRRSGSQNVAAAVGLAKALELAEQQRPAQERRHYDLRKLLLSRLTGHSQFVLNNPQHSVPGIISLSVMGRSGEDLVFGLDAAGIAVATGAACAASNDQPSHVLMAIGLSVDQANSSLRISLGRNTAVAEVEALADQLMKLTAK